MNVINGQRVELDRELFEAMFTPQAEARAEALKARLRCTREWLKLRVVIDNEGVVSTDQE